jgi:hypothetical protein
MTSFVTSIKLMPGYEDYALRLKLYIECISAGCPLYEIIVVDDQTRDNVAFVRDSFTEEWLEAHHTRILDYAATYPNPHKYNMIEAFAKNVGIREAKYDYVCVTNCDVLFNAAFFEMLGQLKPATFYRFLQYETPEVDVWSLRGVTALFPQAVCINPELADPAQWTLKNIAYKSGDVMLMDAASWKKIRGFPENEVWVHSDLIVCKVVHNNGLPVNVDKAAAVYTYPQERARAPQAFELNKTYEYYSRLACN